MNMPTHIIAKPSQTDNGAESGDWDLVASGIIRQTCLKNQMVQRDATLGPLTCVAQAKARFSTLMR